MDSNDLLLVHQNTNLTDTGYLHCNYSNLSLIHKSFTYNQELGNVPPPPAKKGCSAPKVDITILTQPLAANLVMLVLQAISMSLGILFSDPPQITRNK